MSANENADITDLVRHSGSSEENGSDDDESSVADESWIAWFCSLNGNIFFCNIEKAFIEDSFNLFGLKQFLSKDFNRVMDTILDKIDNSEEIDSEDLSRSAALLYGLIHARYIITTSGMEAMNKKFCRKDFGECPRYFCKGQAVLPMGITDEPKQSILKLYCPKCRDIYHCNPNQRHIDGAYFGTTFPHLFLMTYERLVPPPPSQVYTPRVFGFRISGGGCVGDARSGAAAAAAQSHSSSSAGYRSSIHRPQKQPADSDTLHPHPHPHLNSSAMGSEHSSRLAAFPAPPPQDKPAAGVLALHARAGPAARFRGRDGGDGDSALTDSIAPNLEDEDARGFAESPLEQPSPSPGGRSLLFDDRDRDRDRGSIAADSRLKKRKVGDSER